MKTVCCREYTIGHAVLKLPYTYFYILYQQCNTLLEHVNLKTIHCVYGFTEPNFFTYNYDIHSLHLYSFKMTLARDFFFFLKTLTGSKCDKTLHHINLICRHLDLSLLTYTYLKRCLW